jgi:hypothetical protein
MLIRFREDVALPVADVYPYFQSPVDWVRLYGIAGAVEHRGDGWYAVPLRGFPFPLVARITRTEPGRLVRWVFRGFWRGEGEVCLHSHSGGTLIEGYELIAVRWLFLLSPLVEKLFLERQFRRIWASGWRRLRAQALAPPRLPLSGV